MEDEIDQRSRRLQKSQNLRRETQNTHLFDTVTEVFTVIAAVRLMRIEYGGAFADLLNEKGKGSGKNEMAYAERTLGFCTRDLDDRDLKLVTEIVGGTIRWRKYLDYLIQCLCHDDTSFRNMEPLLLQILRIGFYEIGKLDMPAYAVVDENVSLAKYALRPGAGNLVNGILRKLVSLKLGGDARSQARALATTYSHPVWMVRRWTKYLGQEAAIKLMIWNNATPSFSLMVNSGKGLTRDDLLTKLDILKVLYEPSIHLDNFVRNKSGMQIVLQAGIRKEGLCSVQDESAGLAVSVLDPRPGDCIIDCCAAPGGKTLFMASCLNGQGMISAVDVNKGRLRILKETADLQGLHNVITCVHADLRAFAHSTHSKFDKVLLDAPCSGLGVLSKRSDLHWNRRLEDLEELKNLQDDLLDAASKLVETGGVLEFQIDPVDRYVPSDFLTKEGFFRSCPVKHSMDGAFVARLVRQ
ncbi:hypothetical protein RND81_04G173700 [Saponaria officinalis]|uniref:SAM-dependent MTase RsmB/NOP-type domain-containing protein n=1 Tax=Saponaria officinalis TaxID=3572 RepID=A0AAW1LN24_SAPOF